MSSVSNELLSGVQDMMHANPSWSSIGAGWPRAAGALVLGAALVGAPALARAAGMQLSSPTLRDGVAAAQRYAGPGCGGGNVSPALEWSGVPPATRSLALTVFDRDARGGAGWWHWAVVDIPASARGLALGAGAPGGAGLPKGARQLRTSFGKEAYGGPCPPPGSGVHHYEFTLWALPQARLPLPPGAGAPELSEMASVGAIAEARLVVGYGR